MVDNVRNPNPIDVHVGQQVAIYRKVAGLSQEALGEAIGVTFQQVQKYEKGANRIGAGRLFLVGRALDVPISVFFDGLSVDPDPTDPLPVGPAREGIALQAAFRAIEDTSTRRHLLALVRSLATRSSPSSTER